MTFCLRCGAPLKETYTNQHEQPPPAQEPYQLNESTEENENNEKHEKQKNHEKQEKSEKGFIGYLIGGLILIIIGLFSVMQISNPSIVNAGQNWALMLLLVGIIIIISAVYMVVIARRHLLIPHEQITS